jgi:hypothetical protein
MADSFQNGLLLTAAVSSRAGRTFSRWLYEFATQICGWTAIDDDGGGLWTSTKDTGSNGASVSGNESRFNITGDSYTFASGTDEGRYLTITGFSTAFAARKGIYRIKRVISSKEVELDIQFSVHDAGIPYPETGLSWRLWAADTSDTPDGADWAVVEGYGTHSDSYGYDFQVNMTVQSSNSWFPEFELGPFATWNTGADSWDNRSTTARGFVNTSNSLVNVDECRVWAVGDQDRIVVFTRTLDDYISWHFTYLGHSDPFYDSSIDPNPVVMWQGSNKSADVVNVIGYGLDTSADIYAGGRWLSVDGSTTVTGYLPFFHNAPGGSSHWLSTRNRRWSRRTRRVYRQQAVIESRTTSHMEYRGTLTRFWIGPREFERTQPFGRNGEYLHVFGGLIMPWNGSGVHELRT